MSKKRRRSASQVGGADAEASGSFLKNVMLILIAGAVFLGLFWLMESMGSGAKNPAFLKAVSTILKAVATVFATYFLINRALRIRERESDAIIASFVGYIDYLVQTYNNSYGSGPDAEEDQETSEMLNAIRDRDWQYIEQLAEHRGVTTRDIHEFMLDALVWPHYMKTSEQQLLEIHDACQQVTALLGVCTPKLATSAMDVLNSYSDMFRDTLPVIRRGIRGFEKLEMIARAAPYVQDQEYHEEIAGDIAEAIAAGMEALQYVFQKLPDGLEEEMREALNNYRKKLPKRYHEAYDQELEAVGESLDID